MTSYGGFLAGTNDPKPIRCLLDLNCVVCHSVTKFAAFSNVLFFLIFKRT
jgi:hypothetical protein